MSFRGATPTLTPAQWQRVDELYDRAFAAPATDREAVIDACDDEAVRAEVESLLLCTPNADSVIGAAVGGAAERFATDDSIIGRRLGVYRLTGLLGEGGMGAVYLAERDDAEFRREVAIKVLRHGLGSPDAIARFRDERQILAGLDHPGIVRLIDGGTHERLPYLVMERVAGVPITQYARDLSVRDRIALVRKVCDALAYAHGEHVIHRDIKPSNVLVTADGQPKLLDFGIAKLVGPADDREAKTRTGIALLTPAYASPEQARGESVTIATDVYSLGAVLYEVLTGKPPLDLQGNAIEIAKAISMLEPVRPSVAARELSRELAGDLDNIVLQALHKEPAERYASIARLSDDLGRFLAGEPVATRARTLRYRARKLAHRHRGKLTAIGTGMAIAAAGVGSYVVSTRGANVKFRERVAAVRFDGPAVNLQATVDGFMYSDLSGLWRYDLVSGRTERASTLRDAYVVMPLVDGMQLVGVRPNDRIELVDPRTNSRRVVLEGGYPALSHDQRWLAAISADSHLVVQDRTTGVIRDFGLLATGAAPRWSPDDRRLLWTSNDRSLDDDALRLQLLELATGVVKTLDVSIVRGDVPGAAADFIGDDELIYCGTDESGPSIRIREIDAGRERAIRRLDPGVTLCEVAAARDHVAIAVKRARINIGVLDVNQRGEVQFPAGDHVDWVPREISNDGRFAYAFAGFAPWVIGEDAHQVPLNEIDLSSGDARPIPLCDGVQAVVADGAELLQVDLRTDGAHRVLRFRTGGCATVAEWKLDREVRWGPPRCGKALCGIAGVRGDHLEIWKLVRGQPAGLINNGPASMPGRPFPKLSFSPDDRWVVAGAGEDSETQLGPTSGGPLRRIGLPGLVRSVTWGRDPEHFLVSAINLEEHPFGVYRVGLDGSNEVIWSSRSTYVGAIQAAPTTDRIAVGARLLQQEVLILER
jgi:tRNA A-37 threonylcarbamoyl transferase component Bud32